MSSLPSASTRVQNNAGQAAVGTDLLALWGVCASSADGVPRLYSSTQAMLDAHGYCEAAEYAAIHMDDTDKPVLFVPLPISTAGALGRQNSVHTGTSKITVAASAGGIMAEGDAIVKVTRGGTVGTDQILLSLSLDGGTSYLPVRLGTATSYAIPRLGVTITFGAGTLETDDTVLEFTTSAPLFDAAGLLLGKAGMVAQQRATRTGLVVGDVPTLALGQAIQDVADDYETANERYTLMKFQARDPRSARSSALRVAMVGTPELTFAEVGGTGDTITRDAGSWVTDGFTVGDYIRVTGTLSNNVSGKITAVTATVLTLDTTDLAPEVIEDAAVRVTAEPSLVFAGSGPYTLTRNRGSWVSDGFVVGDEVTSDGVTFLTVTALSATVLTTSDSVSAATLGLVTAEIYAEESDAAWVADIESDFAAIDGDRRVDIGAGRLTKLSPITGYTMRRPVQWADTATAYQRDVSRTTWEKAKGPLLGWGIDGEHDERVDGGLLEGKFTCARTWGNGPEGAFIAKSLARDTDGSVLGMTHNSCVANLVQTVVQRATEDFVGATLVLNPPDTNGKRTMTRVSIARLEAKVNGELLRNRPSSVPGEDPRWSSAKWTASTDDDLGIADATLNGSCELNLNGTIVHVATVVGVR